MQRISVAIVENEPEIAEQNKAHLLHYGQEKNVAVEIAVFTNGYDFIESDARIFDVAFMDIDMPGINGMDTAKAIREKNETIDIVFVTNLPQFAIDGYRVRALDFVLKPTTYADFKLAMSKVHARIANADQGSFLIKTRNGLQKICVMDTIYVEVIEHDVVIHCVNNVDFAVRGALKTVEPSISSNYFQKINSGIIVNLSHVENTDGEMVKMDNAAILTISRSHRKDFQSQLTRLYTKNLEVKHS